MSSADGGQYFTCSLEQAVVYCLVFWWKEERKRQMYNAPSLFLLFMQNRVLHYDRLGVDEARATI